MRPRRMHPGYLSKLTRRSRPPILIAPGYRRTRKSVKIGWCEFFRISLEARVFSEGFMIRQPTAQKRSDSKAAIAERLRLVRLERYGEHGGPVLADMLELPTGSWSNYERGVTIPGEILLEFLAQTGIEPLWL